MDFSRRELLGLLAVGALAGCSGGDSDGDGATPSDDQTTGGLPGDDDGSSETSPAGSCAANFGDTMERYDPGNREMIASFGYPMGGSVSTEQDGSDSHVTGFGYGRGDVSPLHTLTVSERGPYSDTGDATEAYSFSDEYEDGTVTTYGGQQRPAAILRRDDSVAYLVRVDGPDGFYEFSAQASAGEGDPCPDTYDSVARRIIESFEEV